MQSRRVELTTPVASLHAESCCHRGRSNPAARVPAPSRVRGGAVDRGSRTDPASASRFRCARHLDQRPGRPRRDGHLPGAARVHHRSWRGYRAASTTVATRSSSSSISDTLCGTSQAAWPTAPVQATSMSSSTQHASGPDSHSVETPRCFWRCSCRTTKSCIERGRTPNWSTTPTGSSRKLAAERFLGYLRSQKAAMTGEPGAHTNRPELVAVHGYDTKFAMHALRLGVQGVELLHHRTHHPPRARTQRSHLRAIRRGEVAWRGRGRHRRGRERVDSIERGFRTARRTRPRVGRRLAAPIPPRLLEPLAVNVSSWPWCGLEGRSSTRLRQTSASAPGCAVLPMWGRAAKHPRQ